VGHARGSVRSTGKTLAEARRSEREVGAPCGVYLAAKGVDTCVYARAGAVVNLRDRIRSIWDDAVLSKVIAAGVIAGLGFLLTLLRPLLPSVTALSGIAAWVTLAVGLTVTFLLLLWAWSIRRRKTLVFLSAGGTCRDPVAKAIASQLFQTRKLKHPIDIRAVGLGPVEESKASYAARYVIKEMYGEDLLMDHKPEMLTKKLAQRADLILVMDRSLLTTPGKTLPSEKTYLLKEFFGGNGDVTDPYPDGMNPETLARYRNCAEELRKLLTENIETLASKLQL
jgi:protein-tyrosine-phosphatase